MVYFWIQIHELNSQQNNKLTTTYSLKELIVTLPLVKTSIAVLRIPRDDIQTMNSSLLWSSPFLFFNR